MGVKATSMRGSLSQIRIRFLLHLAIVLATANFYLHAIKADTHASLVLRGGTILTMDPSQPTAEAIAVQADRIVWLGEGQSVEKWIGKATQVIELEGRTVIPGMTESHGHLIGLGDALMSLDLTGAKDFSAIIELVAGAASRTPKGEWIIGRGWHQEKWDRQPDPHVDGTPVHKALSRISPDHPVLLTHASGHMCLANAHAMKLAGITERSKDPPGGAIVRDANDTPTGVFRENATGSLYRALQRARDATSPQVQRDRFLQAVQMAGRECLRHGITTFHDAGTDFSTAEAYRELAAEKALPVRLYVMLNESNRSLARRMAEIRTVGSENHFLTVRAVKRVFDGALGSHGAWLLEPYEDVGRSLGHNTMTTKSLQETARLCLKHDYQLCVHAIGDRANREVLDVFQRAFEGVPDSKKLRWRIEHAQHLHPDDIPRFGSMGVIASMQGIHATSDGPYVVQRLGLRRAHQGAYAWRRLLDTGAVIANGTDTPVEPINPWACFYASVTRKMANGVVFFPHQAMTRNEALISYTRDATFAGFGLKNTGTLTRGKLADLVVLSHDPLRCDLTELNNIRVITTVLAGKIVWQLN